MRRERGDRSRRRRTAIGAASERLSEREDATQRCCPTVYVRELARLCAGVYSQCSARDRTLFGRRILFARQSATPSARCTRGASPSAPRRRVIPERLRGERERERERDARDPPPSARALHVRSRRLRRVYVCVYCNTGDVILEAPFVRAPFPRL